MRIIKIMTKRIKFLTGLAVMVVLFAAVLWKPQGPPTLPLGINLKGSVELQIEDLETLLVDKIQADNCETSFASQVLLLADDVVSVEDLIYKNLVSVSDNDQLKFLYFTIDPDLNQDAAGRKIVSDSPYFKVSKVLGELVPDNAVSVIGTNYLLKPGQVLYVSFSDDVEYCKVSAAVGFKIDRTNFSLGYFEGDLEAFLNIEDEFDRLDVVNLWRTNLFSNLKIKADEFSNLAAGFYWIETEYLVPEDQAVILLASSQVSDVLTATDDVTSPPPANDETTPPANDETTPPANDDTPPLAGDDTPPAADDTPPPPANDETTPPANDETMPPAADDTPPPAGDDTPPPPAEGNNPVDTPVVFDSDQDGIGDELDSCPLTPGTVDGCPDVDNDLVADADDNCPNDSNEDQADADIDGIGDPCDNQDNRDNDSDGFENFDDNCPDTPNATQSNSDGDSFGDACDVDVDGDGVVDFDLATGQMQDLCLFTSQGVETEDLTEFGCVDGDTDNVLDARDDNRILLTEFLSRSLVVDNCVDLGNENQLDYDRDGLGDVCDFENSLNFSQTMAKIIDPSGCFVQNPPELDYLNQEVRPFNRFPVRFVINHSELDLITRSTLYDRTKYSEIVGGSTLRPEDVFLGELGLYDIIDDENLYKQVEGIWSTPGVNKWLRDVGYDFGWLNVVSGNVSSLIFRDENKPQWNDTLNYEKLNSAKAFKHSYTSENPSEWAIEIQAETGVELNPKVKDFLPEFEGFLPVLYTNDIIFETFLNSKPANLDSRVYSNMTKYLDSPLVELSVFPSEASQKAFFVNSGCSQRPWTSDETMFQRLGQNSSDYDNFEYEFDQFNSGNWDDGQRMKFVEFSFDQTPLYAAQVALESGLSGAAWEFFNSVASDISIKKINTTYVYSDFVTRAFVRSCGVRDLSSEVEGAYDPRIFVPEGQTGWNLLFKDASLNPFEWEMGSLPDTVGECPDNLDGCDFVAAHSCEQGQLPYVVVLKDLVDVTNLTTNEGVSIGGQTCFVIDPLKPRTAEVVAGALKNVVEDYDLDAITSDDYHTPLQYEQDLNLNPEFKLTTAFRDWFDGDLDESNANELFMMLGLSHSSSKSTFYDAIGVPDIVRDAADFEQALADYNQAWVDTAVDVRRNLMCQIDPDFDNKPYMAAHNWNPNISSIGHTSFMETLELEDTPGVNVGKLGTNITEVAENFFTMFATGFWDEKWNRGNLLRVDSFDAYYSMMKMLSANFASQTGYMNVLNQFFMFWNELPGFEKITVSQREQGDTGGFMFQPNAYSLEQSLADLLLVQHPRTPLLSAPYRYHALENIVPDSIQDIFGFYKSVMLDKTWVNFIMNFEYGQALSDPYVMHISDLDSASPNAYVMAREYENAIMIKNFGLRELSVSLDSLPRRTSWGRLVGMPMLNADRSTFESAFRASNAASQMFCPVGEMQNVTFVKECVVDKDSDSKFASAPLDPECFTACNSQIEYMRLRNTVGSMTYAVSDSDDYNSQDYDRDGILNDVDDCDFVAGGLVNGVCPVANQDGKFRKFYDYLAMAEVENKQMVEPFWFVELDNDFVLQPGGSMILYDIEKFNQKFLSFNSQGDDFYDVFKPAGFCDGFVTSSLPVDTAVNVFLDDWENNFKDIVCSDLFLAAANAVSFDLKNTNVPLSTSCDANFKDLKCLLENVFGMDDDYFKSRAN